MTQTTEDKFLGGRVVARQSAQGFRSGLDAVMLAAAVPARENDEILELGCGAGAGALCLAARVPACRVVGIDVVSEAVRLAVLNARANDVQSRVTFLEGDALSLPKDLRRPFDHVFCNPPFHAQTGQSSPDTVRGIALEDDARLGLWLESGVKRVRSQGTFTAILRADRLGEAIRHMPQSGLTVLPLWPRQGQPAKRVILQVRKDSKAPMALLPGLVLHENDGRYTDAAEAILRGHASLALQCPSG